MRSPLSRRPAGTDSIHSFPSGLAITSITVGSASAAAMAGPKAVRSICRRRPSASWLAACAKRSGMAAALLWSRRARPLARKGLRSQRGSLGGPAGAVANRSGWSTGTVLSTSAVYTPFPATRLPTSVRNTS